MIKRILTGMRTTGRLHLGHYVGALDNWLKLQQEYQCYFLLADIQALTTHFDRVEEIEGSVRQVVIDWLSVGLDPENSSFVLQSAVPELCELTVYLSLFVKLGALSRNPTLKEEREQHGMGDVNMGFLTYPISQAADILLYSPSPSSNAYLLVPVGEDQMPHIELTADIARRFNNQYGVTFVSPEAKVGDVPRLGDLGGSSKKMGKSYGNAIFLSDSPEEVMAKVRKGVTDPKKVRKGDPGHPDVCSVFSYHQIFRTAGIDDTVSGCKSGQLGCVECKKNLAQSLNDMLDPFRARRAQIEQEPWLVAQAIWGGTKRAREVGQQTIQAVRHAMHLDYPSLKL